MAGAGIALNAIAIAIEAVRPRPKPAPIEIRAIETPLQEIGTTLLPVESSLGGMRMAPNRVGTARTRDGSSLELTRKYLILNDMQAARLPFHFHSMSAGFHPVPFHFHSVPVHRHSIAAGFRWAVAGFCPMAVAGRSMAKQLWGMAGRLRARSDESQPLTGRIRQNPSHCRRSRGRFGTVLRAVAGLAESVAEHWILAAFDGMRGDASVALTQGSVSKLTVDVGLRSSDSLQPRL